MPAVVVGPRTKCAPVTAPARVTHQPSPNGSAYGPTNQTAGGHNTATPPPKKPYETLCAKGENHDELPIPRHKTKFTGFNPDACGTYPGYRRHQKWGVPACQDCKDAQAAYSRERYVPKKRPGFRDDACGTWAGWHRHKYHNIPTCTPCETAAREYQAERRRARKQERRAA